MKINENYYGLIAEIPKIANPNIINAGMIVTLNSFDIIFLIPTGY